MQQKKRIRIPFENTSVEAPIVKFTLGNGKYGYAVIDTGSEMTHLDGVFVKENKDQFSMERTECSIEMVGVAGTTSVPIVNATTTITVSGEQVEIKGMLHKLSHLVTKIDGDKEEYVVALVGSDFLKQYNADIDYKKRTITLFV